MVHCMALHRSGPCWNQYCTVWCTVWHYTGVVLVGISTASCGALYGITQEWSLLESVLHRVVHCMALHRMDHSQGNVTACTCIAPLARVTL